ncbi:MAG TPA: hypothetical protein VFM06_10730 [Candidatus Limnocylindria bacterium]|nr:hypothetical protein [Candidatus Limnocylindria bacterium]
MEARPPETPRLRPLGVGDIVDRVFALYKARPLLFLALSAIPYLLLVGIVAVLAVALGLSTGLFELLSDLEAGRTPAVQGMAARIVAFGLFVLVVIVAAVVILSAQSAALIDATAAVYLGRPTSFGQAFRNGLRASPRVIGAGLLLFLGLIAAWTVLVVVMAISQEVLVAIVGVIVGMVVTAYILTSTLVMPVAATVEGAGPLSALRRSWVLSEGNRWRVLGLQLLLLILNAVISTLLSVLFIGALIGDDTTRTVIQQVVNVVANVAWAPVQWGTFTVLYYDLRVRREAYDLQLAAEALPR